MATCIVHSACTCNFLFHNSFSINNEIKMGGNVSTRRVTVDQSGDVVQISDALIKRLAGMEDRAASKSALPISGTSGESHQTLPNEELSKWKAKVDGLEREKMALSRKLTQKEQYLEDLKKRSDMKLITKEEFNKAVGEIEGKFVKTMRVALCHDEEQAVLECYRQHPTQPLRCAPQAKLFNDCVSKYHINKSGSRPEKDRQ